MAEGGSVDEQTKKSFSLDDYFGLGKPVNRVGGISEKSAPKPVNAPVGKQSMLLTAEDKSTLADLTPIVGDIKGAYETVDMIADELAKEEPNYYVIGAMGGIGVVAALVGLFPSLGDAGAKALREGAKSLGNVAKRVEVDPNAMGSGFGNVRLTPKKAANITEEPKVISFTKKKEEKELQDFYTEFKDTIGERAAKQNEVLKEVVDAGIFGEFQKGVVVQGKNQKGLLPFTVEGISLNKVKLNNPNLKRTEDQLNIKFNYIEKDGDYYLAMLNTKYPDGASGTAYLDAVKQLDYPIMSGPKRVEVDPNAMGSGLGDIKLKTKKDSIWSYPEQLYDSAATSINASKNAKGYNTLKERGDIKDKDLIVDIGGGKFNNLVEDAAEQGATVKVYDPFNRTPEHNAKVVDAISNGKADMAMSHNVLNVIKEDKNINDVIKQAENAVKPGGKAHFSVYEGNKTDRVKGARETSKGWQRFQTTNEYLPFVESVFGPENVILKDQLITATKAIKKFNEGGAVSMNNQMQQFAEGGLKDEGGEIDEVSGNEVPIGGTKEGVRDDIPANVSEGEFVMPADVVRYHGLDKMMQIRQEAKMGLKKMEAMGQMGNSDEATMDDDMPFGMADLVVVGGAGEPMEFADGGFIPVKDYTEVQDMISDKAQKGAGYANGGSVQSYTDYQGQPLVNSPVNLTGQNTLTDAGELGSVASNLIGGQEYDNQQLVGTPSGMEKLQTADVPMTVDSTGEIDYDAYMNSVTTSTKEYRNAVGESIVVTFINGVPTLPIPDGYTLYTPVPGDTVSPAGKVVAAGNFNTNVGGNDTRQDYDGSEIKTGFAPEPIDYAGMSPEAFVAQMKLESSGLQQFGRALGFGIASMVPFGMLAIGGGMRSHARKAEARLNNMIEGASGEYKAELIATRDAFLKSYSLKPAALSNVFVAAADSYLMGKEGYTQNQVDAALAGVNRINSTNILVEDELSLVDIEPGKTVPLGRYDLEAKKLRPEGTKIQPESQSSTRARAIQMAENAFANGSVTREQADNRIQEVMQFTNIPPGESGDNDETAGRIVRENAIEKRFADGEISEAIKNTAIKNIREQYQKPEYLGGDDLQGTQNFYNDGRRSGDVFEPLPEGEPTYEGSYNRLRNIATSSAPAKDIVFNKNLKNEMKTVGNLNSSGKPITVRDAYISADQKTTAAVQPAASKRSAAGKSSFSVLGDPKFDELAKAEPGSSNSYNNLRFAEARDIQKKADDYYQTGAGMDAYTNPDVVDSSGQLKKYVKDSNKYVEEDFMDFAAPLAPKGKAFIQKPTGLKTKQQLENQRKNEDIARKLAAEEAAANAKQNSAFQNAANELFKNDNKEYRGGVLYSTAGKNEGKRINTAYMDAANLATTNDDFKYVDGILRDKNGKGEAVNNAFQKMANALTKYDGRSYVGGNLIDDKTKRAYIPKDRSTTRVRDPFATTAVPDDITAIERHYGNPYGPNYGKPSGPTKTTSNKKTATDKAKEIRDQNQANIKASQIAARTGSVRPQARPTGNSSKSSGSGSSFHDRMMARAAKGGLIQKPAKTKKPTTPKTKKRGLAARK
jgi:hypothetical protein